jgi:hypothetical protein
MSDEHPLSSFAGGGEDTVAQYPPVSRWAVISLLLALVSFAAIFTPLMWFLPLAGAALAIAALRSIHAADELILGKKAAVAGLLLSLLFLSWGTTRYYTRQQTLYRQARQRIETWLELVQAGRLAEAHQLHLEREQRQAPRTDLEKHYRETSDARRERKAFFEQAPLDTIVKVGRRGRVRYVGNDRISLESSLGERTEVVSQRYALDYEQEGRPQSRDFLVGIARTRDPDTSEARWEVRRVVDPAERSNAN